MGTEFSEVFKVNNNSILPSHLNDHLEKYRWKVNFLQNVEAAAPFSSSIKCCSKLSHVTAILIVGSLTGYFQSGSSKNLSSHP